MPSSNRTFRIFVSSTFSDLKEERDALQKRVFPKLRELCMQNGCRFQAIDLRWGVREEAAFDQQTIKICLEEIKRCQKTKLKPNFIVLLGNRYGWRPAPLQIPQDEFQKIKALLSPEDIVQLDKWYLLDNNAIPAEYVLQPRTGKCRNQENWALVEQQLRAILLKAVVNVQLSENELIKYFLSATEQEIIQGLDDPEAEKHVFCFFRELEGIEKKPRGGFIEIDPKTGKIDHEANSRLRVLKDKLRARLGDNCFEYQASLTNEEVTRDHIDYLCRDVYDSLATVIREEIKHISDVDPLDKEVDDHATFGQVCAKFFVGREVVLRKIEAYLRDSNRQPLAVFGESGSGKTALMAHALQESRMTFPQAEFIFRFIGATPASSDGRSLLESLCRQVARRYGVDESAVPTEYPKLVADFSERLKLATPDKPLIIFLDALDQLSSTDNARNLSLLPSVLPENVHIVVSCLPGECLSIMERKLPPYNVVSVERMGRDEGTFLLNKWLSQEGRCLQPDQAKEVLDKFAACGMPLYLKLAFEEARLWKSYTERKTLSPTIPGIILDMFNRLSSNDNYGEKMLSHSLGYIAAAKNGLTEDELIDVLSLDTEVFDDFKKSSFHEITEDRLPVVVWSRLFFDLEPYLMERSADGTSLLGFYHSQLCEEIVQEYLKEDVRPKRHAHLGYYFNGDFEGYSQPLKLQGRGKAIYNLRKLSELPFQEVYSGLWSQLEQILTNLDFIGVKCAAGMTYDLISDYNAALDNLPENRLERQREFEHQERVKKYTRELIAFANGETKSINIIPSVEIWSDQKTEEDSKRISCNSTRLDRVKAFSQFVNSESNALAKFSSFPVFCLQHAYNFAKSGPVADAAETLVHIEATRPMLLHQDKTRPEFSNHPSLVKTLEGHLDRVDSVCCTPDGKLAISGGYDKSLRIWNIQSGECMKTLTGHKDSVRSVCCTADGKTAISIGWEGTMMFWDTESGECKKALRAHSLGGGDVCCTPNGRLAISVGWDTCLRVWELENGVREKNVLAGHKEHIHAVCCTADGKLAISASDDKTLMIWDIEAGECIKKLIGHTGSVRSVCCTPDGKTAISASEDGIMKVWDIENGKCKKTLQTNVDNVRPIIWAVFALCCTPDGKWAISAGEDEVLEVWDIEAGECIKKLIGHTGSVRSVCCTPDGKTAISTGDDRTLKVWDVETGRSRERIGHTGSVRSVCCTPDGKTAISTGDDRTLKLWETETGLCKKTLTTVPAEVINTVQNACCTPDCRLALAGARGELQIWDIGCEKRKKILFAHPIDALFSWDAGAAICCTPDGKQVIQACDESNLRVLDLENGKCRRILHSKLGDGVGYALCCTPDGKLLVCANHHEDLAIWDINSGECIKRLKGPKHPKHHTIGVSHALCCTPDGKLVISAINDSDLRVWDIETGECKMILAGHSDYVRSVCCTPDSKIVISASDDFTLRAWNLKRGDCIAVYQGKSKTTTLTTGLLCRLVHGEGSGEVLFIQLRNFHAGPPILTTVRLWLFGINGKKGKWDDNLSATCSWCGHRFLLAQRVASTANKTTFDRLLHKKHNNGFVLNLPSACPSCNKPISFNPFIVDNKNRY